MVLRRDHHPVVGPSGLRRVELCPGSVEMERRVREAGAVEEREEASEGEVLHERLDPAAPLEGLTPEQVEAVLRMRAYVAEQMEGHSEIGYERRLVVWASGERVATWGTADVCGVRGMVARVIDAKFGRATLSRETVERQMRAYAAGAMHHFQVPRAEVRVYQPREQAELFEAYSDPQRLGDEVLAIVDRARDFPDLRTPGYDQCLHCSGKVLCPEFREDLTRLPSRREEMELADPERVERLLELALNAERMAEQVKAFVKEEVAAGRLELPGWRLQVSSPRKVAVGVEKAFDLVAEVPERSEFGLTLGEYLGACGVGIGALEEVWCAKAKEVLGITKKAAREMLAERLGTALETTERSTLKRRNSDG
jgi:hypothetical protein